MTRFAVLLLAWVAAAQPRFIPDPGRFIFNSEAARTAEAALEGNADDVATRSSLIDYYSSSRDQADKQRHAGHILWMAEHHPEAAILGTAEGTLERVVLEADGLYQTGESFNKLAAIWRKQAANPEAVAAALGNAGHFFRLIEPEFAAELLERAAKLDPQESRYSAMLGDLYATALLGVIGEMDEAVVIETDSRVAHSAFARKALETLDKTKDVALLRGAGAKLTVGGPAAQRDVRLDFDPDLLAEKLLLRARELNPKGDATLEALVRHYQYRAQRPRNAAARARLSSQALQAMREREPLQTNPFIRQTLLGDIARMAYQAGDPKTATEYAQKLLETTAPKPPDPQASLLLRSSQEYFARPERSSDAIHRANTVLGLVAADRGDLDAAAQFLIMSGKVATSPVLGSFGPSMLLAQALLQKGKPEPVLEYFQLCSAFWKMGKDHLDQWTSDVKAGQSPDFGASLLH